MDIIYSMYKSILGWLSSFGNIKAGILLSCIISLLRGLYCHRGIFDVILDGVICGFLTLVAVSGLSYCGVNEGFNISIGGFIGFVGVRKISVWIDKLVTKKIGG